jgi:hypothetical protein
LNILVTGGRGIENSVEFRVTKVPYECVTVFVFEVQSVLPIPGKSLPVLC